MRTFIAIELPKEIRASLVSIQERLKSSGADVKWIAPENIHLTLKFLGEIDAAGLSRINEIIEEVTKGKGPFQVRISSIGAFPKTNFPRVIWIGIDKGDNETKEIANELEEKNLQCRYPQGRQAFFFPYHYRQDKVNPEPRKAGSGLRKPGG
jgi:2'-5' RNA ligase